MDEFDIIDLVYTHVAAANTGMLVYKDKSKVGETENHIVVSGMEYHEFNWLNVLPVNVNIFIKLSAQSGMPNRPLMREVKRKVCAELKKIKPKNGQYRHIESLSTTKLTGAKEGFDCTNIKVIINTEKNKEDYE